MRIKTLLMSIVALVVIFSINACSPKTKKISIDNSKGLLIQGGTGIRPVPGGEPGQNEFYNIEYNLFWDVEVALNGVDFGVIQGGTTSEVKDVNDANNLKVEKFNILKNDAGLSVYYLVDDQKHYVDFNNDNFKKIEDMQKCEMDMNVMADKFKKIDQAGGLLNDSWNWDISYGENGNAVWNKQKEEEAKKKKK